MSAIKSSVTFAASIDKQLDVVKAAITDLAWSKWVPFLKADKFESDVAGSKRVCILASPDPQMDGYEMRETIDENNKEEGRLAYSIENPPMPVQNLHGVIETTQTETGQVVVSWTSYFEAEPEVLEQVRPMTIQMYQMGLQGLETYLQGQVKAE